MVLQSARKLHKLIPQCSHRLRLLILGINQQVTIGERDGRLSLQLAVVAESGLVGGHRFPTATVAAATEKASAASTDMCPNSPAMPFQPEIRCPPARMPVPDSFGDVNGDRILHARQAAKPTLGENDQVGRILDLYRQPGSIPDRLAQCRMGPSPGWAQMPTAR